MSETNADHAAILTGDDGRTYYSTEQWARTHIETFAHAAAVLSAPLVVDLPPDITPEILTWALRIAAAEFARRDLSVGYVDRIGTGRACAELYADCPPHVVEALRRLK